MTVDGKEHSLAFTLRQEDIYFLTNHKLTATFGSSTINDRNHDREWQKFLQRNTAKGYVYEDGRPSPELRKAIQPILDYRCEVGLTNQFPDIQHVKIMAAFYSSDEGTTFAKPKEGSRREFEVELMADDEMREEVLRKEFGLNRFKFSDDPFSYEFDESTAYKILECGHGRDPYAFRRMARDMGIDFSHLAVSVSVFFQDDRMVILSADSKKVGFSHLITGSPSLGTMVKTLQEIDMTFSKTKHLCTRFERLAEQSFWNYCTRFIENNEGGGND